jgi:hypothetical protein
MQLFLVGGGGCIDCEIKRIFLEEIEPCLPRVWERVRLGIIVISGRCSEWDCENSSSCTHAKGKPALQATVLAYEMCKGQLLTLLVA